MKRTFREEHGQSIVLIALLMIGMIAMLGLVLDGGNAYVQRRRMQNVADAAAFAGGRALALQLAAGSNDQTPIQTAVNAYATYNGGSTSTGGLQVTYLNPTGGTTGAFSYGSIPPNTTGIRVTSATSFQTLFLGVVNQYTGAASASALVQTGKPQGVGNLFPLAVPTGTLVTQSPPPNGQCNFNLTDRDCQIWGQDQGNDAASRQWTSFQICGGGANYLSDVLAGTKSSGLVEVGDSICTATGSIDSMSDDLDPWIGKNVAIPIFDCTNAEPTCPNYDHQNTGSNLKYHVAAFAVFKFTGYFFSNGQHEGNTSCYAATSKYLCGRFQKWATSGEVDPNLKCSSGGTYNYGYCSFQLQN